MTSSHPEAELALASAGPPRLLSGGGTAFEQRLLQAAHSEPVPDAALQRLARALHAPLEPAASSGPAGAGAGKAVSRWITANSDVLLGADAVFDGDFNSQLTSAGDRDGDGDGELLQVFRHYDQIASLDAALLSGEQSRLSGAFTVPGADAGPRQQFPDDPARSIQSALAAGDLDRNGVGDLISESAQIEFLGVLAPNGFTYATAAPQLHIYYGVPAIERVH